MDNDFTDAFFPDLPSDSEADQNVEQTQTEVTPEVTETAEETTETTEANEPARDDKGRFTPKEERPSIPLDALIEERNKRQEAERQRQEIERQLQELQAQQQSATRPDPFDDPDGYSDFVQKQIDARVQQLIQDRDTQAQVASFHSSRLKAEQELGADKVQTALKWAEQTAAQNDAWGRYGLAQPDPVKWFVEQQNRHAEFEEYARDPHGFLARKLAEQSTAAGATAPAQTNAQAAAKVQAPKSVASMGTGTSAPKVSNETDAEFLRSVFAKK